MKQTNEQRLAKKNAAQKIYRKLNMELVTEYARLYQQRPEVKIARAAKMRELRKSGKVTMDKSSSEFKARKSVGYAVYKKRIPAARDLICACGHPAQEYHHHNGYEIGHRHDVVALCRPCHLGEHSGR